MFGKNKPRMVWDEIVDNPARYGLRDRKQAQEYVDTARYAASRDSIDANGITAEELIKRYPVKDCIL